MACTAKGLLTTSLSIGTGMTHGSSRSQPYDGGASHLRPSTTSVLGYHPLNWVGSWGLSIAVVAVTDADLSS